MSKRDRLKKRIVVAALAWVMAIIAGTGLMPAGITCAKAYAAAASDIQVGDHVYMGKAHVDGYSGLPYWRVIDKREDGSLLFMSEYLWRGDGINDEAFFQFDPQKGQVEWQQSHAKAWCRSFEVAVLSGVSGLTIQETTCSDGDYTSPDYANVVYEARENILNNDHVFFLSAKEVAETYMKTKAERVAYLHDGTYRGDSESWWLRSPRWLDERPSITCVGRVFSVGDVGKLEVYEYAAARPVFWGKISETTPIAKCTHGSQSAWVVGSASAQPQYAPARYLWSVDNTTCTAEAVCTTCGTTVSETVRTSSSVTVQPTVSNYGIASFTARFTTAPFTTQVKKGLLPKQTTPPAPSEIYDSTLPKISIKAPAKAKKAFTAKWKKLSKKNQKKAAGIEVQYALNKGFTNAPVIKTAKKSKASLKVKKLKAKKTYWVRIRTYKNVGGVKHVSNWSKAKKVKTK